MKKALPESFNHVKDQFKKLKAEVCVPLATKRGLVGILVLGQKANDTDYSQEDLEILEMLANHASIAIQSLKLQEELRETKELEAFHKLSSFIVHDIRNTVSMLSMLVENAKLYITEPEFHQSLFRTLSNSVDKMKDLISKISMASKKPQMSFQEIDVNELITATVEEIKFSTGIELQYEFKRVPKIFADYAQLRKVMVNLVLNAAQAMPNGGRVLIKTNYYKSDGNLLRQDSEHSRKEFVEVAVSDSGEGMSEEFIYTKLFKPFQSTKKDGVGIGLYHCKEIIESHGGQIWAESKIGSGSTFYISLPVKKSKVLGTKILKERDFANDTF